MKKIKPHLLLIMLLCTVSSFALGQEKMTASGTVTDNIGYGIQLVTVTEKGSKLSTMTDNNGHFELKNVAKNSLLVFSSIGFETTEISFAGTPLTVVLQKDVKTSTEVVVTALGIKKTQRALGYSTQKVEGAAIAQSNAANIGAALSGKVAGVNINNTNGVDGSSTRIVIRGDNNIQGNNQPLIIIDGIPLENNPPVVRDGNGTEEVQRQRDFGSGLNYINNQDIEDMNVLKGPAAAALYGARGANGVILITTKKGGKKDGVGLDYSITTKISDPYRFREQQNEYGYGGLHLPMYTAVTKYNKDAQGNYLYPKMTWGDSRWDAIYGVMPDGIPTYDDKAFTWHAYSVSWGPRFDGQPIKWSDGVMRPFTGNPKGQEYYFKTGVGTTHNLAFSTGGDFGSVRASATYEKNNGIVYNTGDDRLTFNVGSDLKISNKLRAEIVATYNNNNRPNVLELGNSSNISKYFYQYPTDYRPDLDYARYKDPINGSKAPTDNTYGVDGRDIFWDLYENTYAVGRDQLLSSAKLSYNPLEWLTLSVRSGMDFHTTDYIWKKSPTDIAGVRGYYEHKLEKEKVTNTDFLAYAHKDNLFINKFNAGLSVGATRWDRKYYQMGGRTVDGTWSAPDLYTFGNYDLSKQSGVVNSSQVATEDILNKRINSVYGFLDLSYDNFLFAQITGRNDWSSTLPSNNNSYFYPSASLSFVFSELMNRPNWFDFGKVRVAYANAATDADPYQTILTYNSGSFGGAPMESLKDIIPIKELKPQKSNSYEFGFNTVMLDRRFKFDFTYYHKKSYNQIMESPLPLVSGYTKVRFNSGKVENKGFEVIASYDILRNKDWSLTTGINFANNQNKLLSLSNGVHELVTANMMEGAAPQLKAVVGESLNNIYGWDYVYNSAGQKVITVIPNADPSKVGTLYKTTSNRVKIGNATPDVIGGINASLRYKNWNLFCMADGSFGGDIWSATYATSLSSGLSPSTLKERDGGGLPFTYPDGTNANHGVLMEGVIDDGSADPKMANTNVVHYGWKYGRLGAWGPGNLNSPAVLKNNWLKMREISLMYSVPENFVKKTKVFQNLGISVTGRDLFYIYSSLPDKLNPEVLSNQAGNAQGLEFGALPGVRSFSISLKAGF